MSQLQKYIHFLVLIATLILTVIVYKTGLSSPLLYDDQTNLLPIYNAQIETLDDFITLVLSNTSGPLDRPIGQWSFVLQKYLDYFDVADLKLINLIIHLLCGLFIYRVISQLISRSASLQEQARFIAVVTSCLWLLHPLNLSTVLYTIQRFTQLATLFSLISISMFIYYANQVSKVTRLQGFIIPSLAMTVSIAVAVLSKENAILLFPALLLIVWYLGDFKDSSKLYKAWILGLLILPTLYAIYHFVIIALQADFTFKGFTADERILTQSRVILSYLGQILLPDTDYMTLYHDDYRLSKSLTDPISTILALVIIVGMIGCLFIKKIPKAVRLGIAWFFCWHLIESTVLPLHIYFEHRNYLPSIGIIMALVFGLAVLRDKYQDQKIIITASPVVYGLLLAFGTFNLSKIWSDNERVYTHWLENHPESVATLISYSQIAGQKYNPEVAVNVLTLATRLPKYSNAVSVHLTQLLYQCLANKQDATLESKLAGISGDSENYDHSVITVVENIIQYSQRGACNLTMTEDIKTTFTNIVSVAPQTSSAEWQAAMHSYYGFLLLRQGMIEQAVDEYTKSYYLKRNVDILIPIIDLNISLGNMAIAEEYLSKLATTKRLSESQHKNMLLLRNKLERNND